MRTLGVVSVSGGPDSAVALYFACETFDRVIAVTFHYAAIADKEVEYAKRIVAKTGAEHIIVDVSFLKDLLNSSILASGTGVPIGKYEADLLAAKSTIVPFRNGIFLSILIGMAASRGGGTVLYGAHYSDGWLYPDCRASFVNAMCTAAYEGTGCKVFVSAPFVSVRKSEVFRTGVNFGVPLSETWSCYAGGEIHCGQCGSCIERQKAFHDAGIADDTVYERPWSGPYEE